MQERLACGHTVDIIPCVRVYTHYDTSFGVVTRVGKADEYNAAWHDLDMDGSPYKGRLSRGYYDASRLICENCGRREVMSRFNDPLEIAANYELVRP